MADLNTALSHSSKFPVTTILSEIHDHQFNSKNNGYLDLLSKVSVYVRNADDIYEMAEQGILVSQAGSRIRANKEAATSGEEIFAVDLLMRDENARDETISFIIGLDVATGALTDILVDPKDIPKKFAKQNKGWVTSVAEVIANTIFRLNGYMFESADLSDSIDYEGQVYCQIGELQWDVETTKTIKAPSSNADITDTVITEDGTAWVYLDVKYLNVRSSLIDDDEIEYRRQAAQYGGMDNDGDLIY